MTDVTDEVYGDRYFGAGDDGERERLGALAGVFDPVSLAALREAGVRAGRRCLEVGAGRGTVARWLADRVGADGTVVAIDRNARWLREAGDPRVIVREALLTARGPWPAEAAAGGFDVVHARMTVMHQPDRPAFLARLAGLLRPGGVLVVGDTAEIGGASSAHPGFRAVMTGLSAFMADSISSDTCWGRHYPSALTAAGLVGVTLSVDAPVVVPGEPLARFWELTIHQTTARLVDGGYATASQVDGALRHLADPATRELSFVLCTATGRRPE